MQFARYLGWRGGAEFRGGRHDVEALSYDCGDSQVEERKI